MIGLPAVFLGAIAMLRIGLYWRQRRRLLLRLQGSTSNFGSNAAIDRAGRLLLAELRRILVATALLILIAASAFFGWFGAGLVAAVAACAYVAESIIANAGNSSGMPVKGVSLLAGACLSIGVASVAASLNGHLVWLAWLLATMLAGIFAIGIFQLSDWLWLRPRRERRRLLADQGLLQRMQSVARDCGVDDVRYFVIDGDTHIANARAESDPRGRRVVLWPALIQRLKPVELDSVIAHELGHLVLRHLQSRFANAAVQFCMALALSSLVAACLWAPAGVQGGLHVASMASLLPVVLSCLRFRNLSLYRRQEIEADRFVAAIGRGQILAETLIKLSPSLSVEPESDSWHHLAYDSHPPTGLRLAQLRSGGKGY